MELKLPIYLDYNATTPVDPRVLEVMLPYFTEKFGNAGSRTHQYGWIAEEAVNRARQQVAGLIGSVAEEIVFTSGATEAGNLALKGVFETYAQKGHHIITCLTEHSAVLDTCRYLEKRGADITYLDVDSDGLIRLDELEKAIRKDTILISIMYANNETGVIQPVREISSIARKHDILFFTDATQAIGKIPVNVAHEGIDIMAFSAHKIYGPKGIGALYVRRKDPRVTITAQMTGGGQERGRRSGTLNVPGIVGLGKACELCMLEMESEADRLYSLRYKLEKAFLDIDGASINGNREERLPQTSNISFSYAQAASIMTAINSQVAIAAGSACASGSLDPSHVLKAMGLTNNQAKEALRFSLGRFTIEEEITVAVETVTKAVSELRKINPDWGKHKKQTFV